MPIDNNWLENRIRPIVLGRQNWPFAGSMRAGNRAAAAMNFIHSAKSTRPSSTGSNRTPIRVASLAAVNATGRPAHPNFAASLATNRPGLTVTLVVKAGSPDAYDALRD